LTAAAATLLTTRVDNFEAPGELAREPALAGQAESA
jgi:hypothetical protein